MFVEIPQTLILATTGAFLFGWILASISARLGSKYEAKKRDPRDDRIRSLEAEHRIAHSEAASLREKLEKSEKSLEEATEGIERRDNVITEQLQRMESIKRDLKESVLKTRELRHELSDRATENVKSEVKLREVETELEVAQASTDMIATGVLDYSLTPDKDQSANESSDDESSESGVSKAAT